MKTPNLPSESASWRENKRLFKIFKKLEPNNNKMVQLDDTKQFNNSITDSSYPISHKDHSIRRLAHALIFYTMFTDTCALRFCILKSLWFQLRK